MRKKLPFIILGAVGLFLGFPHPFLRFPLMVLLYPAALAYLALTAKSRKQAFGNGFFTSLLGSSACLYWITVPMHNFGGFAWPITIPFPILLASYIAFFAGVFTLGLYLAASRLFLRAPITRDLSLPLFSLLNLIIFSFALWSSLEYLRGWVLSGFPWLTVATAFAPWPWAVQGASAIGVYGLSGLYVSLAVCAVLVVFFSKGKSFKAIALAGAFFICALAGLSGWMFYSTAPKGEPTKAVGLLLVQGNINQGQKWDKAYLDYTINKYQELTTLALNNLRKNPRGFNVTAPPNSPPYTPDSQIVIWPETAMPFFYQENTPYSRLLKELAKNMKVNLLFGAPAYEPTPGKSVDDSPFFNRAYLINSSGQNVGSYDKEHLVPFGEYVPSWLRLPVLDFFLKQVGAFENGKQVAPLKVDGVSLGVLICYEAIFPELAEQRVNDGANILVNISNDAWFGDTSAPEQHLQLAIMRAVEQDRYLVRSTNSGITTIIDNHGRRITSGRLFTEEAIACLVYARYNRTLFNHIAGVLPYFFMAVLALQFLLTRRHLQKAARKG